MLFVCVVLQSYRRRRLSAVAVVAVAAVVVVVLLRNWMNESQASRCR